MTHLEMTPNDAAAAACRRSSWPMFTSLRQLVLYRYCILKQRYDIDIVVKYLNMNNSLSNYVKMWKEAGIVAYAIPSRLRLNCQNGSDIITD